MLGTRELSRLSLEDAVESFSFGLDRFRYNELEVLADIQSETSVQMVVVEV